LCLLAGIVKLALSSHLHLQTFRLVTNLLVATNR
jgi:hypothetical protein